MKGFVIKCCLNLTSSFVQRIQLFYHGFHVGLVMACGTGAGLEMKKRFILPLAKKIRKDGAVIIAHVRKLRSNSKLHQIEVAQFGLKNGRLSRWFKILDGRLQGYF